MRRRRLTVPLLVLLLAGGCSSGGKKDAADGDTAAPASSSTTAPVAIAPAVEITAKDYAFDVPPEIEGGVMRLTLRNDGKFKHEAVIVAAGDTPLSQLKKDLTPIVSGDGKPTPDYLRFAGGVSLVDAGTAAAATITLPVGRYVMVCTLTDADTLNTDKNPDGADPPSAKAQQFHFDRGMATEFVVKKANTAVMPPTDGAIVARDWAFELPPLSPGFNRTFTFRNDGQQDHSLAVAEFAVGVDADAARSAFETLLRADAEHPPPDNLPTPDDVAFAGPLSAGGQATLSFTLKPNQTYVFACYMSDRAGGPLHAAGKGMVAYATTGAG